MRTNRAIKRHRMSEPRRYTKKSVTIQAIQYTVDNIVDIWEAFGAGDIYGPTPDDHNAYISTLEGRMKCSPGDFIIKGVAGELYPCKPDIFEQTYEEVWGD